MGSFGEVTEFGHGFKSQFLFDPKYTNLNHGTSPRSKHLSHNAKPSPSSRLPIDMAGHTCRIRSVSV
jgi:hypothetical protein